MKKWIGFSIIFLALFIAFITNPTPEMHKEALKEKINLSFQQTINSRLGDRLGNLIMEKLEVTIGSNLKDSLINKVIDSIIINEDYIFCSISKMELEGKIYPISIGAYNHVYVPDKIKQTIEEKLSDRFLKDF